MAVIQRRDAIDGMNQDQRHNRCFYTSYSEMNEVLNRFVSEAELDNIWMSAEVQDLKENRLGNRLCEIVSLALDTARKNCIETTPPRGRYIKIRSREMQQQMLIKIQFSCDDRIIRKFDKGIVRMRELVESSGGYLKIQLIEDAGNIRIAIPDDIK